MQLQHQVVVFAAQRLGDVQRIQQPGLPQPIRLSLRQELARHGLEILAHAPHARRAVRVEVGEHAQDPLAIVGARRKRIDMHALVVGAHRLRTRLDLLGPKARRRHAQLALVLGQQAVDKALCLRAKTADHGGQRLLLIGAAGRAFQHAVGAQAHVALAGGQHVFAQQRFFIRLQLEAQLGEKQHLARLDGGRPFRPRVRLLPIGEIDLDDG